MMRVALPAEHRGPHRSLADAAGARLLMSANRPAAATFLASAKTSAENIVGEHLRGGTAVRVAAAHGILRPHFKTRISGAANYVRRCVGRMTRASSDDES
jgi:hypothetical protein